MIELGTPSQHRLPLRRARAADRPALSGGAARDTHHRFGLAGHAGQLQTFTFQTLLFFASFSIVSIRERRAFWASRPSTVLAAALSADACAGLAIGFFGLAKLKPISPSETALILGHSLVCSLGLNDVAKRILIERTMPGHPETTPRVSA